MKRTTMKEFAAFVGIDWADAKHYICLQVTGSKARELTVLPHRAERIDAWAQALRKRFCGTAIAVCLERNQRPARLSATQVRLLRAVSNQSQHVSQMPPSLPRATPKTIPPMLTSSSICCCAIAISSKPCIRKARPFGHCNSWWRTDVGWSATRCVPPTA